MILDLAVPLMVLDDWRQGKPLCQRSGAWPRVRAEHLAAHPTCAACGTKEALEVHHVWPVSWPDGETMELDPLNLLTMCHRDHLYIGHLGDWKARNPTVRRDAEAWLEKTKTRPYPPERILPMETPQQTIQRVLEPQRSWFSDWWRKITNNPKTPEEFVAHSIVCNQIMVFPRGTQGKGIVAVLGGRTDGNIYLDFITADGKSQGSLVFKGDGTIVNNLPAPNTPSPPVTP